jgi:DNA primase
MSGARQQFDRALLPTPARYLDSRGLLTAARGSWAAIRCPAHKQGGESNPSLRVNLEDGHFRCMACGAKGGDVLALHRLITGAGFIEAARELGALR